VRLSDFADRQSPEQAAKSVWIFARGRVTLLVSILVTTRAPSPDAPQPGQPCPCGSGKIFDACCSLLLSGSRAAETAEELMRSRFTAHVAKDYRYLHRTYAATASQPFVEEEASDLKWTRLVVHSHEAGNTPEQAFVDFSAYFTDDQGEHAIHEKSEFRRTAGQWLYTRAVRTGPAPFKSAAPKPGRNDPCPCGSGKKYKQCCLV
jgi:SEC-C motif domain protein